MTSGRADGMIPGPTIIMADAYDYDVFFSYNSANRVEVEGVAMRLRDEHGLRVFFDAWNVVAGDSVIEVLERAIERSRTIVVFLGADGMGPWHDAERQVALGYAVEGGRRVIPVLLPGARKEKIPGFLRARSWVELAKEDGLARLVAGIAGRTNDSSPTRTGPRGEEGPAKPEHPHEPEIAETEGKEPQGRSAPLEAKPPPAPASGDLQAVTAAPRPDSPSTTRAKPVEHRLSILHISDLHARSLDVDDLPDAAREQRRRQVHREAASRARVLGPAWEENLRRLYPNGERPDLVCFTGDVADWGLPAEYLKATELVERTVSVLGITNQQVYIVPGNHDVQRYVNADEWRALRELLPHEARAVSDWLAGGPRPRAIDDRVAAAVLERTAAFWQWVALVLGRSELLPDRHAHGSLGYHHVVSLPRRLPFDVHVIGLDSAWLAGDDHDQGKLWLTAHQRDMLLHDVDGQPWTGFRLALVHHPLEELAQSDAGAARRTLAETVDLLLHGHQHDPVGSSLIDLDGRTLRVLAAGCLYEGNEGSEWKNGCHRIDVVLDQAGRPLRAEIQFRAWSSRGHWHADSSLYRTQTADGRMTWEAWNGRVGAHDREEATRATTPSEAEREPASRDARHAIGAVLGHHEIDPSTTTNLASLLDEGSRRRWDATAALIPMLEAGPTVFVEALERILAVSADPASSRPRRVAEAIDGLGQGSAAAKQLLEACFKGWNEVRRRKRPEVLRESTKLVRNLVSEWLPRRYGDGTQVQRLERVQSEAGTACADLVLATSNTIITDVHVAAEDDRRLELETRGTSKSGTPKARWSLPTPVAFAAEIKDPIEAADEITAGFAGQFSDVLLDDTPEARRTYMRDHFQLLREIDEPRYMVVKMKEIPEAVLVALKRIFPPLRIVSLQGSVGGDEGRILQILVHFFKDRDDVSVPT